MSDLTKLAAIQGGQSKVNRLILANIGQYAALQSQIEEFVANPTEEAAADLESQFKQVNLGHEAIGNALITLVKTITGEGDLDEVDVTYDEQGARLQ